MQSGATEYRWAGAVHMLSRDFLGEELVGVSDLQPPASFPLTLVVGRDSHKWQSHAYGMLQVS